MRRRNVWVLSMLGAGLLACGDRAATPPGDMGGDVTDAGPQRDAEQTDATALADGTPGLCIGDDDCRVLNDCCSCWAVDRWTLPEQCLETCDAPVCDVFGFDTPKAVCIEGHCHLAEGKPNHCQTEDDCTVYQDCCYCMAVPKTVKPTPCQAGCSHDACALSGLGLDKQTGEAHFACFQGECHLMSVD